MRSVFILLLTIFISFSFSNSYALDLPNPPPGFTWVEVPEVKAAFLKPKGWFFKKNKKGETLAYFITKENISESGRFITGTSINIVPNIPKKTGVNPSKYAHAFISAAVEKKQVFKNPWKSKLGPFNSFGVVTYNIDKNDGDYITHLLTIANDQTGTIYIVVFEAPSKNWDQSWNIGKQILGKLYIDSDI